MCHHSMACQYPRPHLLYIHKQKQFKKLKNKDPVLKYRGFTSLMIDPPAAKIHRCRPGCCPQFTRCQARAQERVSLTFKVTSISVRDCEWWDGSLTCQSTLLKMKFNNHTECECIRISSKSIEELNNV